MLALSDSPAMNLQQQHPNQLQVVGDEWRSLRPCPAAGLG